MFIRVSEVSKRLTATVYDEENQQIAFSAEKGLFRIASDVLDSSVRGSLYALRNECGLTVQSVGKVVFQPADNSGDGTNRYYISIDRYDGGEIQRYRVETYFGATYQLIDVFYLNADKDNRCVVSYDTVNHSLIVRGRASLFRHLIDGMLDGRIYRGIGEGE